MRSSFYQFIRRSGPFSLSNKAWEHKAKMTDFWSHRSHVNPALAEYAIRLASTTANTTISERGFSSLQRIQTKLRSRLTSDRLDKLIFINMNAELIAANASCNASRTTRKRKRMEPEDEEEELNDDKLAEQYLVSEALIELREHIDNKLTPEGDDGDEPQISTLALEEFCM